MLFVRGEFAFGVFSQDYLDLSPVVLTCLIYPRRFRRFDLSPGLISLP